MQDPVLSPGHNAPVIAAIDLGSNSFHLIISRVIEGTLQPVMKQKIRVQLASGLDHKDKLSTQAIDRGIEALKSFSFALKGFPTSTVRVIGTHTLRRAKNAQRFIRLAKKVLPYPIEVVSGGEEARLIYQGIAHTQISQGKRLIIDIGGGSTEVILGQDFDPEVLRSITMGCVTFSQEYFDCTRINQSSFDRAGLAATDKFELAAQHFSAHDWTNCVGTSGTNKAMLQLARIVDPTIENLTLSHLKQLRQQLINWGDTEHQALSSISPQRRRVLPGGLAILIALFERLSIETMEISEAALREGVLYEMDERLHHQDIRSRSVEGLAKRYYVDHKQANRVLDSSSSFFEQLKFDWKLKQDDLRVLLHSAALLHETGLQVHTRAYHHHSAYILQHSDLPGFNQQQQDVLVTLVQNCRKRPKGPFNTGQNLFNRVQVLGLCCILRLAILLHHKRQSHFLPHISVSGKNRQLTLTFPLQWLDDKPSLRGALKKEQDYQQQIGMVLNIIPMIGDSEVSGE